jgi:hypothetical protein
MKKELRSKIELVCRAINQIFADDEKRGKKLILDFTTAVAEAPNEVLAEEVVDTVIDSMNQVLEKPKRMITITPGAVNYE